MKFIHLKLEATNLEFGSPENDCHEKSDSRNGIIHGGSKSGRCVLHSQEVQPLSSCNSAKPRNENL